MARCDLQAKQSITLTSICVIFHKYHVRVASFTLLTSSNNKKVRLLGVNLLLLNASRENKIERSGRMPLVGMFQRRTKQYLKTNGKKQNYNEYKIRTILYHKVHLILGELGLYGLAGHQNTSMQIPIPLLPLTVVGVDFQEI